MDKVMDISYRRVTEQDYPHVCRLINSLYKIQRPVAYQTYQWSNTAFEAALFGAFIDQELVGVFGVRRLQLTNGLVCGYLTNLNVRNEWQGHGIFRNLGMQAIAHFRDLDLLMVIANTGAKPACEKAFGMEVVLPIQMLHLKVDQKPLPVRYTCTPIRGIFPGPGSHSASRNLELAKTGLYRSWRFGEHPFYQYSIIKTEGAAYAVVKIFEGSGDGLIYGDIVEYDIGTGAVEIFSAAIHWLHGKGVNVITTYASPFAEQFGVLTSRGFCEQGPQAFLLVKATNGGRSDLYEPSAWHLQQIDFTNY